jgi:hypothetical protein
MKKYSNLLIIFSFSILVGCSTPKNLTPATTSLAIKPIANAPTETSLLPKTNFPTVSVTPLLTLTPIPTITITPFPTFTATYLHSPTVTPFLLPVSEKVRNFFSQSIPNIGTAKFRDLKMINIGYEKNIDTNLTLKISIQCYSGTYYCGLNFARDAFIYCFADPDPQPDKVGMFPINLEEFKVIGYDENMNQIEIVIGKWSDLVEYEKGNLIFDDFLERLIYL